MSTRIATISVQVEISAEGPEEYDDIYAEVLGEIESGIQRTGLAYAWAGGDPRWEALKAYVDANLGVWDGERLKALTLLRAHIAELEAADR